MMLNQAKSLLLFFCFSVLSFGFCLSQKGPGYDSYRKGLSLKKNNACGDAVDAFDEAIKLEPDNYKYHFSKGQCYYKLKDMDNALTAFQSTIDNKPDYGPAYSLMAKIYQRAKDYDKTIYFYNEAANYETDNKRKVKYKMVIVNILLSQGKPEEAKSHIAQAKQIDPENLDVLYYDAKISNQAGDYENAKNSMLVAAEKLSGQSPGVTAKYFYELGLAYSKLGDYANAKKYWEEANFGKYGALIKRELSKNSPKFFYNMAVSYYYSMEYNESKNQIDKALELQNDFSPGYILMAKMARKQGDMSGAVGHLGTAVEMASDESQKKKLQMMVMSWQMSGGDFKGVISSANNLLEELPGNTKILYKKMMAQYKLGQYAATMTVAEEVLSTEGIDNNSRAQFSFVLGMAAKNSSDLEKAKEAFKGAMYGRYKPAAKNEYDKLLGKS